MADTIHLAADATKTLTKDSDALNACNYARAGALEAYSNVDRIVNLTAFAANLTTNVILLDIVADSLETVLE